MSLTTVTVRDCAAAGIAHSNTPIAPATHRVVQRMTPPFPEFGRLYEDCAVPSPPARGQRLRGADLRNRVVSAAAAGDWLLGGVAGPPVGGLHDRIVCEQCGVAARRVAARASAESLCRTGARDWRLRPARIARRSTCRAALCGGGHAGCAGPGVARDGRRRLPVAADRADGRVAAGAGSLAGSDPQ